MKRERPSIQVHLLDQDSATAIIRSRITDDIKKDSYNASYMAVVDTPKGLATICTEGVGWWANENDEYIVDAYFGSWSETYFMFTREELLGCVSSETVDLAEFIRSFGDRLESNFDLWYHEVKDTPQTLIEKVGA